MAATTPATSTPSKERAPFNSPYYRGDALVMPAERRLANLLGNVWNAAAYYMGALATIGGMFITVLSLFFDPIYEGLCIVSRTINRLDTERSVSRWERRMQKQPKLVAAS